MKPWLSNNLGLKLLALALAIVTWFYVSGEISRVQDMDLYGAHLW